MDSEQRNNSKRTAIYLYQCSLFRRCEAVNKGLSKLCKYQKQTNPIIWADDVIKEFMAANSQPSYINKGSKKDNFDVAEMIFHSIESYTGEQNPA